MDARVKWEVFGAMVDLMMSIQLGRYKAGRGEIRVNFMIPILFRPNTVDIERESGQIGEQHKKWMAFCKRERWLGEIVLWAAV